MWKDKYICGSHCHTYASILCTLYTPFQDGGYIAQKKFNSQYEWLNLRIIRRFIQHHLCTQGSNDSNPIVGDSVSMLLAVEGIMPSTHVNELQFISIKSYTGCGLLLYLGT